MKPSSIVMLCRARYDKSARSLVVAGLPAAAASRQLAHRLETAFSFPPPASRLPLFAPLLPADWWTLRTPQTHVTVTLGSDASLSEDSRPTSRTAIVRAESLMELTSPSTVVTDVPNGPSTWLRPSSFSESRTVPCDGVTEVVTGAYVEHAPATRITPTISRPDTAGLFRRTLHSVDRRDSSIH